MKRVYSVYDVKARAYGPVFGVGHDAVAIREFGAAISQNGSTLGSYPNDFELHCVGSFSDPDECGSGEMPIVGFVPMIVITARQWLDSQPKEA